MDKIGKIIVQEKCYELAWNGGVRVNRIDGGINIETDLAVWLGEEIVLPKDYVLEVIGRAVREFLYQDITPFALAGSSNRWKLKTFLIDRDSGEIVVPDKGLNSPRVVGIAPKEWLSDACDFCKEKAEEHGAVKVMCEHKY